MSLQTEAPFYSVDGERKRSIRKEISPELLNDHQAWLRFVIKSGYSYPKLGNGHITQGMNPCTHNSYRVGGSFSTDCDISSKLKNMLLDT